MFFLKWHFKISIPFSSYILSYGFTFLCHFIFYKSHFDNLSYYNCSCNFTFHIIWLHSYMQRFKHSMFQWLSPVKRSWANPNIMWNSMQRNFANVNMQGFLHIQTKERKVEYGRGISRDSLLVDSMLVYLLLPKTVNKPQMWLFHQVYN